MTNKRFFALFITLLIAVGILGGCTKAVTPEPGTTTEPSTTTTPGTTTPGTTTPDYSELKIGQVEYAAHGTKSFCVATAVVAGDKVVAAYLDEFQYMPSDKATGVPNSDTDFGTYVADKSVVLASKRVNADYYSENMKTNGGATQRIDTSLNAIEKYCVGMTVAELDKWITGTTKEGEPPDTVAGSTLADTAGYIKAIATAAKAATAQNTTGNNTTGG